MKHQTLVMGSILAVGIVAVVVCVGMVSGYSVFKPFISVNPISDKNIGDDFNITGTTNLPTGTEILVEVYPASFEPTATDPQTGAQSGTFTGASGTVTVTQGTGNINTWSMDLNTITFSPGKLLVNASVFTGDAKKGIISTSEPIGTREFTLDAAPGNAGNTVAESGQYITISPVADKTTSDLLIVTGSTNLPTGTSLMIQVNGTAGNTEVNLGSDGVNRYSMPIDTSILKPGTLTITVTQMTGDPAKGNYKPGNVKATASFTLKGTFLATDTPVQPTITGNDYIQLNAIGNRFVGDQFLITGTTSLPVGTNLLWQIMPDTGTPPTGVNMTASGDGGNNMVTKGSGTANRVSFAADMSNQVPGKWVVLVGVAKEGQFEMEKPMGTAYFTLQ
ncbi:hypothetical protein [Methanoregula sp.]|uniref:hypothetical protein n=1 Tax=Methanoregula sp. TaxID=2052170 RepID=UPI003BB1DD3E